MTSAAVLKLSVVHSAVMHACIAVLQADGMQVTKCHNQQKQPCEACCCQLLVENCCCQLALCVVQSQLYTCVNDVQQCSLHVTHQSVFAGSVKLIVVHFSQANNCLQEQGKLHKCSEMSVLVTHTPE